MGNFRRFLSEQGFISFLELLLVLVIVGIIVYSVLNIAFKKPAIDKEIQADLTSQGIDTSNYQALTDSVRNKVKEINKQIINRESQADSMK